MVDNEFQAESGQKRKPCIFSREALSKLTEDQLQKVTDALEDEKVSAPGIARVVKRWIGVSVHDQAVLRHRNKVCGCFAGHR